MSTKDSPPPDEFDEPDEPAESLPSSPGPDSVEEDGLELDDLEPLIELALGPLKEREGSQTVLQAIEALHGSAPRILLGEDDSEVGGPSPIVDPRGKQGHRPIGAGQRYQILGEIARGGMGVILKSRDVDLGRDVALKVLHDNLADKDVVVQRFVEEAQIGGQLQHPGIVPVYELGLMADDRPYFTMKLVKGRTLAALLTERASPQDERRRFLSIFESVCQTMAYAHSRDVIHRDLKPSNVMVGAFGEVQVMDWGLSKVLPRGGVADERRAKENRLETALSVIETVRSKGEGSEGSDSLAGAVMGTPAYMPPEQARGEVDRLDERADVFALGAVLCEILTGSPPYAGDLDKIFLAANAKLEDATARLEDCDADRELVDLALTCLSPSPAGRPRDARAVAEVISTHLVAVEQRLEQAHIAAAEAAVRAQAAHRNQRLTAGAAVAVGVALVAAVFFWRRADGDRDLAEVAQGVAEEARGLAQESEAAALESKRVAEEHEENARTARAEAEQEATRARENEGIAEERRREAEQLGSELRRELYVSSIAAAQTAIESGDLSAARRHLESSRPGPGVEDLRGFEWGYLWNRLGGWRVREQMSGRNLVMGLDGTTLVAMRDIQFEDHSENPFQVDLLDPVSLEVQNSLVYQGGNFEVWSEYQSSTSILASASLLSLDQAGKTLCISRPALTWNEGTTWAFFGAMVQVWDLDRGERLWARSWPYVTGGAVHSGDRATVFPEGDAVLIRRCEGSPRNRSHDHYFIVPVTDPDAQVEWGTMPPMRPNLPHCMLPGRERLVTGGLDGVLSVWGQGHSGRPLDTIGTPGPDPVTHLEVDPTGSHLVVATEAQVSLLSPSNLGVAHVLGTFGEPVASLSFDAAGRHLAVLDIAGNVRVWDLSSRAELERFSVPVDSNTRVFLRGESLFTTHGDQSQYSIREWPLGATGDGLDLASSVLECKKLYFAEGSALVCSQHEPPGASKLNHHWVQVWDSDTGALLGSAAVPGGSRHVGSVSSQGRVEFADEGPTVFPSWLTPNEYSRLVAGPDGRHLVGLNHPKGQDSEVALWDVAARAVRYERQGDSREDLDDLAAAFAPDGSCVALADLRNGRVLLLEGEDWSEGQSLLIAEGNLVGDSRWQPRAMAFSPDGERVFYRSTRHLICFDRRDGHRVWETSNFWDPMVPRDAVLAVSPDGRRLALGTEHDMLGRAGSLLLLDVTDGRVLARVASSGRVTRAAFSEDGARLAFMDGDTLCVRVGQPEGEVESSLLDAKRKNQAVARAVKRLVERSVSKELALARLAQASDIDPVLRPDVVRHLRWLPSISNNAHREAVLRVVSQPWDSNVRLEDALEAIDIRATMAPEIRGWYADLELRGRVLASLGRPEEAVDDLAEGLRKEHLRAVSRKLKTSLNLPAVTALLDALVALDRPDEARAAADLLETAMRVGRWDPLTAERLVEVRERLGPAAERAAPGTDLTRALDQYRARHLRLLGAWSEVIDVVSRLVADDPPSDEIQANLELLAEAHQYLGDATAAADALRRCLEVALRAADFDEAQVLLLQGRLGVALLFEEDYAEAEPMLRDAMQPGLARVLGEHHDPVLLRPWLTALEGLGETGRFAATAREMDLGPSALHHLARRLLTRAAYRQLYAGPGLELVDSLLDSTGGALTEGAVQRTLALALVRNGDPREALEILAEAPDPRDDEPILDDLIATLAFLALEERPNARVRLRRAEGALLETRTADWDLWCLFFEAGDALWEPGEKRNRVATPKMREALAAARRRPTAGHLTPSEIELILTPFDGNAHNNLAWDCVGAKQGYRDLERGLVHARLAVLLDPTSPYCLDTLGMALFRSGQIEEALLIFEQVDTDEPDLQAWISLERVLALVHLDRREEAEECFARAEEWRTKEGPGDDEFEALHAEARAVLAK